MSSVRRERDRIRAEYRRRDADARLKARYAPDRPWAAREGAAVDAALRRLLDDHGLLPLSVRTVLEVGCGSGPQLARLARVGGGPRLSCGIDLSRPRLQHARAVLPGALLVEGDAAELPFRDGVFDLVAQFTVLSSITDPGVRALLASEMARVVDRDGAILSYDMRITRPRSPLVPIGTRELRRLFPAARADVRTVTLAPPVARLLDPRAPWLAALLARVPWLRTHHLALLRPAH